METVTIDKEQLNKFENIPSSGLDNITSASIHEITDEDIFKTADIADVPPIPEASATGEKKTVNVNKQGQTTPTKLGGLVGGELAIRLLDAAIPALFVTVIHYIGYKLEKQKLKLNSDDRKVLAPLVQDALNAIEIDFNNPFINLAFGLSIIYGSKIIEEIPNMERRNKKQSQSKIIQTQFPLKDEQIKPIETIKKEEIQDVSYDFSEVYYNKPKPMKIAPEYAFKADFDALIETTRQRTGRKSRRGVISYLYQYEKDVISELLKKYGFSEPPNDNDYKHVKERSKNIDFTL